MAIRLSRRLRLGVAALAAMVLLAAIVLFFLPLGILRGIVETRLSARFDAPVAIARIERLDRLSLHPRIRIAGVRIGQPDWVGKGDLVTVDEAVVRIAVIPILRGAFLPEAIDVHGLSLNLVRDAAGRANWEGHDRAKSSPPTRIAHLTISGGRVTLNDAKRRMTLDVALLADPQRGIAIEGPGTHRGLPMRFTARGGVLDGASAHARYPFVMRIASPLLRLDASGRMDRPLDLNGFDATMRASGRDIVYLDDVIEAGLPGTQAFALTAIVRHDAPDWTVKRLRGTLGRSVLDGAVSVRKRGGRTILEGHLDAAVLDFDSLASDAGLARAAAKRRSNGPRIIPDTEIHFEKLSKLDGTLKISARRLLMNRASIVRGFSGTLTMDHRRLTLDPLTIRLTHGVFTGRVAVDHRAGDPKLTVDLKQVGMRLSDLIESGEVIEGPVAARVVLNGMGRTVRAAMASANGRLALTMRGGTMQKRLAVLASGDIFDSIGQAIGGSKATRVPVNCLIARFTARAGSLSPAPLLLDTAVGRADGSGSASLASETLALAFTGRSKRPDPIQLAAKLRVGGGFSSPTITVTNAQGQVPRKRNLLGRIGGFLGSIRTKADAGRGLPVPAADCDALAASALR